MARTEAAQLNIRSRFARERATMLARETGLTTTQVVEEALRAFQPPSQATVGARLIRKGAVLVRPSGGDHVSLIDAEATLDDVRTGIE